MTATPPVEVEYITDELCRIVGHGPGPHRLGLMPQLRRVCGATALPPIQAGSMVASYVGAQVLAIDEPICFDDLTLDPEIAKRCFLVLLKYEASHASAMNRRMTVIQLLGRYYGLETWRHGLERKFLHLLGEIIYSSFNPDYQSPKPLPAASTKPSYA